MEAPPKRPVEAGSPKASFRSMLAASVMMSIGAGVLALPQHVARTGVVAALAMSCYVGLGIWWCMLLMLRAKVACEERGIRIATYQDLGTQLLGGEVGRRAVEVAVCGFQFGVLCVFQAFLPSTLRAVFPGCFAGARRLAWMIVLNPLWLALCCLRYLRDLGDVAQLAATLYAVGWALVVGFCLARVASRGVENTHLAPKHTGWSVVSIFAALSYSFEGVPAALCQIVDTLDDRSRARELVSLSLLAILGIYTLTEFLGAFAFDRPDDPLTLSLVADAGVPTAAAAAINLAVALAVFLKYALMFFPLVTILERNLGVGPGARLRHLDAKPAVEAPLIADDDKPPPPQDAALIDDDAIIWVCSSTRDGGPAVLALRASLVLLSALVAFLVDDLTVLIDLVGILFAPLLAMIFPIAFDIVAKRRFGPTLQPTMPFETSVNAFFLATATLGWLFGTGQAFYQVVLVNSSS